MGVLAASLIAAALSASALQAPAQQDEPRQVDALTQELRRTDEKLLLAVHRGNKAAWDAATTPDFTYVEEGSVQKKPEFLSELENDGSQPLVIQDYSAQVIGDTALVRHTDKVPLEPGDTRPAGQYLMTETWQKIDGSWKMRIVHIDSIRTSPPAIVLSAEELAKLAGDYVSRGRRMSLLQNGSEIVARRSGRPDHQWKVETRDDFFLEDNLRGRWIVRRDAVGLPTAVIYRDENSDSVWTRVTPAKQP